MAIIKPLTNSTKKIVLKILLKVIKNSLLVICQNKIRKKTELTVFLETITINAEKIATIEKK